MDVLLIIGIVLFVIFILLLIIRFLFFREYAIVMGNFETLIKVLETRDLLLMRLLPEIKNKKIKDDMSLLVSERMDAKRLGNDKLIETDVKINKKLNRIYTELNNSQNPIVREELRRIVSLEKKLKVIRREYNKAVEVYNNKLTNHPKIMIKFWKMRPLNLYDIHEK